MRAKSVDQFVDGLGGVAQLARQLEISTQSVYGWIHRGHVPAERALQMQRRGLVESLDDVPMRKISQ